MVYRVCRYVRDSSSCRTQSTTGTWYSSPSAGSVEQCRLPVIGPVKKFGRDGNNHAVVAVCGVVLVAATLGVLVFSAGTYR